MAVPEEPSQWCQAFSRGSARGMGALTILVAEARLAELNLDAI